MRYTREEKNLENVLTNGRQTTRKINKRFQRLVSSSGKRRKTDNNKKKKEAEKRTDEMCGYLSGNELTRNTSGNTWSQSSQLAEPLWNDPGLKTRISVRELISTKK